MARPAYKVKHLFKWGALFKVKNGLNCRFWQHCWLLNVPLKIAYEDLFRMVRDSEVTVADCWIDDDWWLDFKRELCPSKNLRDGRSSRGCSAGFPWNMISLTLCHGV